MINPIADIAAIAPTIYKSITETTFTPIINKVRNNNIDTIPTETKKYFKLSIIFIIYVLNNNFNVIV